MSALATLAQADIRQILAGLTSAIAGISLVFIMTGSIAAGLALALIGLVAMTGLMMIAGTVIHAADRQTDLSRLGGLWRRLPLSTIFSFVLIVALTGGVHLGTADSLRIGVINLHAYASALGVWGMLLCWAPLLALPLVSISLLRWWWRIFIIKSSASDSTAMRESPLHTFPPLILLVGAWVAGSAFLNLPLLIHRTISRQHAVAVLNPHGLVGIAIAYIPWGFAVALLLVGLAYSRGVQPVRTVARWPGINLVCRWLEANMYVAEMYSFVLARPIRILSVMLAFLDEWIAGWLVVMLALGIGVLGLLVATVDGMWTLRWWPPQGRRMPPVETLAKVKAPNQSAS
jgi:NADH:ubiquinone oxidoreductase subunit 5 (subunit L)/multisubunit Na+/H+ antiporter MnhA subunit